LAGILIVTSGAWKLFARDIGIADTGQITEVRLTITASRSAPAQAW